MVRRKIFSPNPNCMFYTHQAKYGIVKNTTKSDRLSQCLVQVSFPTITTSNMKALRKEMPKYTIDSDAEEEPEYWWLIMSERFPSVEEIVSGGNPFF